MEMTLRMPSTYVDIDRDEMEYIDGGAYNLNNSTSYLSKVACQQTAYYLLRYGYVTEMTQLDIAKEIYAHAILYYGGVPVTKAIFGVVGYPIASYIANHAAVINIDDGGDTTERKFVYNIIWSM